MTDEQDKMLRAIYGAVVGGSRSPVNTGRSTVGQVVSKATFDASDPVVKIQPKAWFGDDMRGRTYSACPPDFLGKLATMLDQFADKNEVDPERQKYAKWDRANAATARSYMICTTQQRHVSSVTEAHGLFDSLAMRPGMQCFELRRRSWLTEPWQRRK